MDWPMNRMVAAGRNRARGALRASCGIFFRACEGSRKGRMDSFLIRGGTRLKGKVEISGSKNSALPILAACLMAEGKTVLKGVPRLTDIDSMLKLLGEVGCHVYRHEPNGDGPVRGGPALNGNLDV